jgi:hypothetical protein
VADPYALGLAVEGADGWSVTAPARRFDLAIEEDLVEEIARIHGYDAIPTTLPGGATRLVSPSETRSSEHDARRQLVARDYLEAINYAFVDADLLATWQLADGGVALANPLSAELGVMRTAPGLVAALAAMPRASSRACACSRSARPSLASTRPLKRGVSRRLPVAMLRRSSGARSARSISRPEG